MKLISIKEASEVLGVCTQTLRRWEKLGYIKSYRTTGNHRRYDLNEIEKYMKGDNKESEVDNKITVGYARVSTGNKKEDLQRQKDVIEIYCTKHGFKHLIIEDIGSGLNYNRKGLNRLIELIEEDKVSRLIINYKDRLLRSGSEIIFKLCDIHNVEVVILNTTEDITFEQELVQDVLSIITVYSAKLYGKRSFKNKKIVEENKKMFSKD